MSRKGIVVAAALVVLGASVLAGVLAGDLHA